MIDGNSPFVRVGLLALVLFAITEIFLTGPGPRDELRWVGYLVSIIGIVGVIWSRWTLGRSFSVKAKATALVTSGLYSRIRNPIYVSGMVLFAGVILMFRRPWLWGLLVPLFVMQFVRARREAAVLEQKFGDEYRRYRERTWF